jgi:hypothetical protein
MSKYGSKFTKSKYPSTLSSRLFKLNDKVDKLTKRAEVRVNSITVSDDDCDIRGREHLINGMGLGDADGTRDGTRIAMKSFRLNGEVNLNEGGDAPTFNEWRVLLFIDKQPNLASIFGSGATKLQKIFFDYTDPLHSMKLWGNNDRISILFDQSIDVDILDRRMHFSKFIKLKQRTEYGTTAQSDITGITTNALWLLFIVDAPYGTIPLPKYTFHARLVYSP